jgi:hypothetical protein
MTFFSHPTGGEPAQNRQAIDCRNGAEPSLSIVRWRKMERKGRSDVTGVTGAPHADLRLIRAFPNLCQFGNEWSVNMLRIALDVARLGLN